MLRDTRGVNRGGRRGIQPVEIPCAIQLACEKCQDFGIAAAFGQVDSLQHYDNLDICVIAAWLSDKGAPRELVAATVAFQMFSRVSLCLCGQKIIFDNRTTGALTGTRVAGQLGRVPIEASMLAVHKRFAHLGLPMFVPNASAEKWKPHYLDTDWEPFC